MAQPILPSFAKFEIFSMENKSIATYATTAFEQRSAAATDSERRTDR